MQVQIVRTKEPDEYELMADYLQTIKDTNPGDKAKWGPMAWKALHNVCSYIPCETCRDHCHDMLDAEHDVVNAFKGKDLYQPENTKAYFNAANKYIFRMEE